MAQMRIHQNLQAINRILEEVKEVSNRPVADWHNANLRLALRHLKRYSRTAREEEFGNTIPEIAQHIEKLDELLENIEADAQGIHFRNAFRANLDNLENLNVNFKEVAKNTLNSGARAHRTLVRRVKRYIPRGKTRPRRGKTLRRRRKTRGRRRKTRGRRRKTSTHKRRR